MRYLSRILTTMLAVSLLFASCGSNQGSEDSSKSDLPTVVVTTNILGDVVENLVGDELQVVTLMPVGADPHDFQPSAQQVAQVEKADAVIANGADFEENLIDIVEAAESDGVPTFEAISAVESIDYEGEHKDHADEHKDEHADEKHSDEHKDEHSDHADEHKDEHADEHADEKHADDGDEHADEKHSDEHKDEHGDHGDHADEHKHDHGSVDPHFFTDPARMKLAADEIVDFLTTNVDGVDVEKLEANAATYISELESLDSQVETLLADIPSERRVLVTNHEVFGYFADRYDFEVVGSIIPSGNTLDGASAKGLNELAEIIEQKDLPAIFADTSSSDELARTLSKEVGDVEVVELFSESLGPDDSDGATYQDMVLSNAQRIADAFAS